MTPTTDAKSRFVVPNAGMIGLFSASGCIRCFGAPAPLWRGSVVAVGDDLAPALTAASGDSSSKPDHSPGSRLRELRTRHRRPCRASTVADSSLRSRPSPALRIRTFTPDATARPDIEDDAAGGARSFIRNRRIGAAPGTRRPGIPTTGGADRCDLSVSTPRAAMIVQIGRRRGGHRVLRCRGRASPGPVKIT